MIDAGRGALRHCGFALWVLLSAIPHAASAQGTTCKYVSQLPDDCIGAELRKYDNLRNARYEEIDLVARDVIKKLAYESVYNTTGLNGADNSGNSAPQDLARNVDPKAIAKTLSGSFRVGKSAAVLDDRLARRQDRERKEFRRSQRRVDGQWPGAGGHGTRRNRPPAPIAMRRCRAPPRKGSRRGRRSIASMIPRAEPGS